MIVRSCQAVNGGHDATVQVAMEVAMRSAPVPSFTINAATSANLGQLRPRSRIDDCRLDAGQTRLHFAATRTMAATLRSMSASVVLQLLTLMRMAVRPCH